MKKLWVLRQEWMQIREENEAVGEEKRLLEDDFVIDEQEKQEIFKECEVQMKKIQEKIRVEEVYQVLEGKKITALTIDSMACPIQTLVGFF